MISLNSFIASIRPMTWPTATSPPTARTAPTRRRRRVEDPGERRLDRRLAAVARLAAGRRRLAAGRGRSASPRPPTTADAVGDRDGRERRRLAQDEAGAAGLDLELGQVGAVEQRRQPVDQAEQLDIAAVAWAARRLGRSASARRDGGAGSSRAAVRPARTSSVMRPTGGRRGRCSGRRTRTSSRARPGCRGARDVRRQVEALAGLGSGSSRLIVGGTHAVAHASGS